MSKVTTGRILIDRDGVHNVIPELAHLDVDGQYVPASIADELLAACELAIGTAAAYGAETGNYEIASLLRDVVDKATQGVTR